MIPFFEHSFNSVVWRFEIDGMTDRVLLETRNAGEKKVSFSSISLKTGEIYFKEIESNERWLTGIETAWDGVLLLHQYQGPNGPNHKGIIAVDQTSGKVLWENYSLSFDHLSVNGPIVFNPRFQPQKLQLLDIQTGSIIRQYEPAIDQEYQLQLFLPEPVQIEKLAGLNLKETAIENSVDYLEHNKWRIVSLHAINNGVLQQSLYLINGFSVVFEDLLNIGIQKMQPESFLVYKDQLIYLKNHSQLKVLNL